VKCRHGKGEGRGKANAKESQESFVGERRRRSGFGRERSKTSGRTLHKDRVKKSER
jgi:hypothetical protein